MFFVFNIRSKHLKYLLHDAYIKTRVEVLGNQIRSAQKQYNRSRYSWGGNDAIRMTRDSTVRCLQTLVTFGIPRTVYNGVLIPSVSCRPVLIAHKGHDMYSLRNVRVVYRTYDKYVGVFRDLDTIHGHRDGLVIFFGPRNINQSVQHQSFFFFKSFNL